MPAHKDTSCLFPTTRHYEDAIVAWAEARGIIQHSTARAQLLKLSAEYGELADGIAKKRLHEIADGIGDTFVCLVNHCRIQYGVVPTVVSVTDYVAKGDTYFNGHGIICDMAKEMEKEESNPMYVGRMLMLLRRLADENGLFFINCIDAAYCEIKDRKGQMMPGGVFVKEGDVAKTE